MSTKTGCGCRSLKAIPRIRAAVEETAPRVRRPSTRSTDPERILYPLRRTGKRGEGKWERVTWDEVLDDLASRIRLALQEGTQERNHVSRRASGARVDLQPARAARLGHRRTQQPHQCLLGWRAHWVCLLARLRPPVSRSLQGPIHSSSEFASGGGTLFQSPRAANHRRQNGRGKSVRHRYSPIEHSFKGRLLALDLAGK